MHVKFSDDPDAILLRDRVDQAYIRFLVKEEVRYRFQMELAATFTMDYFCVMAIWPSPSTGNCQSQTWKKGVNYNIGGLYVDPNAITVDKGAASGKGDHVHKAFGTGFNVILPSLVLWQMFGIGGKIVAYVRNTRILTKPS